MDCSQGKHAVAKFPFWDSWATFLSHPVDFLLHFVFTESRLLLSLWLAAFDVLGERGLREDQPRIGIA
jgi:hypothetical protein